MPVNGQETVAKNIVFFGEGFLKHVNVQMEKIQIVLDDKVVKNMSLTDHSLKDLAQMGHPYSRRHPMTIHDPKWAVHTQSGKLLESKESGTTEASVIGGELKASAFVGLNVYVAEHADDVIYGTSRMVPRDFLTGSLNQVKKEVGDILRNNLRDIVFNFKGVSQ